MQMTLYFIHPAITVLMAWLVLGETATWVSVVGCVISLLGVTFIAKPPIIFGGHVQYTPQHWLGTMHVAFVNPSSPCMLMQARVI